jgi:hypothetical protein
MAGRTLNRRALREHNDEAERADIEEGDEDAERAPAKKPRVKKTPGTPKPRKPRAKKLPPRLRARWGIFDGSMKQVAIFDFNQRAAADDKLAELLCKKLHFLQIVKEPILEPVVDAGLPI